MKYFLDLFLSKKELTAGLALLFISAFLIAGFRWVRLHGSQAISAQETVHVYVDETTGLEEMSLKLEELGLIDSREEFLWAAKIFGWRTFLEGHYLVEEGFSYNEFLSKMAKGIQDPVSVTILPGRTEGDIVDAVSRSLQFDSLSFQKILNDTSFLSNVGLQPKDVIGYLYPSTVKMYWTITPKDALKRILEVFNKSVIEPYQERFEELDKTVDEILTLASIVQWEARKEEERDVISGLYWNRLQKGMRLQADPTVNFAVGERRRLLYEDYEVEHPYNTYLYAGLPPGPITNPSLSSIEAALYPAEHEYLFMVASPDGSHAFSETYEEHLRKSEVWREWLQKQYRIKRRREAKANQ
ncbi:MAG TPA: endolytic transglycosylase MltG [Balneolaceae bacterium]